MALIWGSSTSNPNYVNYGGGYLSPQSSQTNPQAANYQNRINTSSAARPNVQVATGSVLSAQDQRSSGGGGGSPPSSTYNDQPQRDNVQSELDMFLENLNRDYEATMSGLGYQEQNLRGQAGTSQQSIEAGYAPAVTAIGEEQATREAGLSKEESTARSQEKSALQQARDLYRQTQQGNISQLSALGLSSSSVTEALAEKLGVETARRIAGVTGSTQEIIQNIAGERTRVQTYYKQKLADLEQTKAAEIAKIQQGLMEGLNQINQARNQAASDKANRRAELYQNAQSAFNNLNLQSQKFQQSLQEWTYKRDNSLQQAQQFVVTPTDFSALINAQNSLGNIQSVGGFNYVPTYSIDPSGKLSISIKGQKDQEEEPL